MITNQSYQVVRPAVSSDINAILEILDQPMQHAQIVHRPHGYLQKYFKQFVVLCIDEDVVGCCELIPYTMNKQVEISTFAIRVQYRSFRPKLLQHVVTPAPVVSWLWNMEASGASEKASGSN